MFYQESRCNYGYCNHGIGSYCGLKFKIIVICWEVLLWQNRKKFYYIQYSPYGVRISPDSLNGNAFSYYAFTSYAERQKWLDGNDMDGVNWVAATITRAELVERIGKRFVIVADYGLYNNDDNQVAYKVLAANDADAVYCIAVYYSF